MNNTPVDVMRSLMGVDSVLVVDVEGRDEMGEQGAGGRSAGTVGWLGRACRHGQAHGQPGRHTFSY